MGDNMNRLHRLMLLAGIFLCAGAAAAQTVSPVIVEYREKARGSFQITNDLLVPMNVVVEARSFSVDNEGKPTFRALDPEISVELSATSFKIPPKQSYTVFYKATASKLPAWFSIYSSITGPQAGEGIKLVLELPHTVYLLTRRALPRESVVVLRADAPAGAQRIESEIENRGAEFSRVQEVQIFSAAGKKEFPGFPLFPGQRRRLSLEWDGAAAPQKMILKFANYQIEQTIRPQTQSP
ncbi:MAG TPA: hypothetical protein VNL38_04330 [Candidatus Nitrosotenuis sp.]|nr:hypothetical protein [Candidatus Nitrosotenuis sp.]